jgi:arsenite-transporting ATPase
MRIITFTGKGGVGKTSIAAATALRLSELGLRTLVMSTDPAHSLSDSLDLDLSAEPKQIRNNLWAMEVNAYVDLKNNWDIVQRHYSKLLLAQGVNGVMADEMTVLPGMEEVFSLMRVKKYKLSGQFDAMVLDTAPTGETLRLLSLPDTLSWGVKAVRNIEKFVVKPLARPLSKLSDKMAAMVPPQEVFDSVDNMFTELEGVKEILNNNKTSTVRLVMNAEKMVIKETQRALTYLNLYEFRVDMVIVNKLLSENEDSGYLNKWKAIQQKYLVDIQESFAPLPIRKVQMYDTEVVGLDALSRMANDLYADTNPADLMYDEEPTKFLRNEKGYEISVKLPFMKTDDLEVWVSGDELYIQLGNQRKVMTLPIALTGIEPGDAEYRDKRLIVPFPIANMMNGNHAAKQNGNHATTQNGNHAAKQNGNHVTTTQNGVATQS